MVVSIEIPDPIHVARVRHVGPYADVGPCFERLFRWAASIGAATGRVLTLSYDDPETTAADRLRVDACGPAARMELVLEYRPPVPFTDPVSFLAVGREQSIASELSLLEG